MGIPSFFRELIKKHRDTYFGVVDGKQICDYLFLDYNGIVYDVYGGLEKSGAFTVGMTKTAVEAKVIEGVIKYTKHIVNETIQPRKLLFFSFDGPAPRMKMVQQRSRRFKGFQIKQYKEERMTHYKMPITDSWDASANISPGTEFMEKLAAALLDVGKKRGFVGAGGEHKLQVLISNSNVPGEGEQKFLPIIRNMRKNKSEADASIYIYSPDADMIVLAMATHKSKIHIFRSVAKERDLQETLGNYEFIALDIDKCKTAFKGELTKSMGDGATSVDEISIMNDYNFLTFLVGNDFVISLPFFKIRKGGMELLQKIYNDLRKKGGYKEYLVDYHPDTQPEPKINHAFFVEILKAVADQEQYLVGLQQKEIDRKMKGIGRKDDKEDEMTPYQIDVTRYEHWDICIPGHPLYAQYIGDFKKINYRQEQAKWKAEYYKHFVGISLEDNPEEYHRVVEAMCINYIESLVFNLRYYLMGCPSWTWHYRYLVAPYPSDIMKVLSAGAGAEAKISDVNKLTFDIGKPYAPFEQLLLILPPQMAPIIPAALRPIMTDPALGCVHFYPSTFRINAVDGMKSIYSEAILPDIDESLLLKKYQELEGGLTDAEKSRNTIRTAAILIK